MKQEMLSARIDHETKGAFTHICEAVGLSTSQAIKLFAKAVINYGGIPFDVRIQQPNQVSIAAMKELDEGMERAESVNALMHELTRGKVSDVQS